MNFKSFPRRVAASCCCVRHYAIFSENSRTVVTDDDKKLVARMGIRLNADAVLDAISIVPSVGIEVVGRATVHPIAGAKVTAY